MYRIITLSHNYRWPISVGFHIVLPHPAQRTSQKPSPAQQRRELTNYGGQIKQGAYDMKTNQD